MLNYFRLSFGIVAFLFWSTSIGKPEKNPPGSDSLLELGIQHFLGYEKSYDPELASAWIHAAAYDGNISAQMILGSLQNQKIQETPESEQPALTIALVEPDVRQYFRKIADREYGFNYQAAYEWNRKSVHEHNPTALYNTRVMSADTAEISFLFAHVPNYFRREKWRLEQEDELTEILQNWNPDPETVQHADTCMLAFQHILKTEGLTDSALDWLEKAIKGGSLRARLYRLKFLNDVMLSEEDSVASNEEVIDTLLQQNYPPVFDIECARLHAEIEPLDSIDDPYTYLPIIQNAVRFGYEYNSLGFLGAILARTQDTEFYAQGFHIYEKAASLGMKTAYFSLGFCYQYGFGTESDLEKATFWLHKAHESRDATASHQLGWIHLEQGDFEEAFHYFETAAELGDGRSQLKCALMLLDGIGIESNKLQAYTWFEAAAEQGNATACIFCGYFQDNGWLGERDEGQALYYYRKSIMTQSRESFEVYFRFLKEHLSDPDASIDAMLMVVDEMMHWVPADLLVKLGLACWENPTWKPSQKWDRAYQYFEAAQKLGDERGNLMTFVLSIHGYPGRNTSDAVNYFKTILEQKSDTTEIQFHQQAVTALALAYLNGMGAPLDYMAYLDLVESETLPEPLRNELDNAARTSNAYYVFRNQAAHSERYRKAQFTARKNPHHAPPEPIIKINPQYPRYLKEMGMDGTVTLSMAIDENGQVMDPKVESSTHPGFEEPALRSLAYWKFLPCLKNGKAVRARIRLPMVFRISASNKNSKRY